MIEDLLAQLRRPGVQAAGPGGTSETLARTPQALEAEGTLPTRPADVNPRGTTPIRFPGLVLHEQFDSEGDILWVLEGRGDAVCSSSIRAIDAEIRRRLTLAESIELQARPGTSPHGCITNVLPDEPCLEYDPAPEAAPIERLVADLAPESPEPISGDRTPRPEHPWRKGYRHEAAEAAERGLAA